MSEQSIETKPAMKFFCHIKVCDKNHARSTFIVKHVNHTIFLIDSVQNYTSFYTGLDPFKLHKVQGQWRWEFETKAQQPAKNILLEIINQLDEKLKSVSINS